MSKWKSLCLATLLALPAGSPVHAAGGAKKLYHKALAGAAWVRTPPGDGSGWVGDRARQLVVTNYHAVLDRPTVHVVFPEFAAGKLIADKAHYSDKARKYVGRVVDVSKERDLAVIQVEALPTSAAELKLAGGDPDPSDAAHSGGTPRARRE